MTTRSESIRGSGQVLDGFIIRAKSPAPKAARAKDGSSLRRVKQNSAQAIHRKIDRSQALMRTLVRKPKSRPTTVLAPVISNVDVRKRPQPATPNPQIDWSKPRLDKVKLARAQTIDQHKLVRRFGRSAAAVRPKVKSATAKVLRPVIRPLTTVSSSLHSKGQDLAKPLPSMVTSASHYQLERLLDWALVHADAHKQSFEESTASHHRLWRRLSRGPRSLTIGLPLIILLTAVISWLYLRVPTLSIKLVDWRAGVAASVPSYSPSGFKLVGAPSYKSGQVNLNYQASDPSQNFQISQRASDWDSAALLTNYIKPANLPYQMTETGGKTIYTYGPTNATWVEGGIWYIITDNAQLNADQIARIATSF